MEALDLVRPELTTSTARKAVRVDARLGEVKPVLAQPSELRELCCSLIIEAREAMAQGGVLTVTTRQERDGASLVMTHPIGADAARRDPFASAIRARRDAGGGARSRASLGRRAHRRGARRAADAAADLAVGADGGGDAVVVACDARSRRGASSSSTTTPATARRSPSCSGCRAMTSSPPRAARMRDCPARASARPFDVALVDLAMPDMNGVELARRLRARDPALRIALVTGWEPSAVEATASRASSSASSVSRSICPRSIVSSTARARLPPATSRRHGSDMLAA